MDITNPAWIALIISIIGTIASPLITTCLTNKHQYKMKRLEIEHEARLQYIECRRQALDEFVSKTGVVLLYPDIDAVKEFGQIVFLVYQYVPSDFWHELDYFYSTLLSKNLTEAKELYPTIISKISEILKEESLPLH